MSELLNLRKIDSDLEGHPTPRLSFIDVPTGSLSVACGMAYCGKFLDKASYTTYCLMGDGESMEGNIWEALNFAHFAGHYKLDNLCAIIDVNRLGQSDPAPLAHDMDRWTPTTMMTAMMSRRSARLFMLPRRPVIIAKTFKGRDLPAIEDQMNWHGKPLGDKTEAIISHLTSLIKKPEAER